MTPIAAKIITARQPKMLPYGNGVWVDATVTQKAIGIVNLFILFELSLNYPDSTSGDVTSMLFPAPFRPAHA